MLDPDRFTTNQQPDHFSVKDVVNILPRTFVGMNKLGGIARVRYLRSFIDMMP